MGHQLARSGGGVGDQLTLEGQSAGDGCTVISWLTPADKKAPII